MSDSTPAGAPAHASGAFGAGHAYRPDSKIEKTLKELSEIAEGARVALMIATSELQRAQRAQRAEHVLAILSRSEWHDRQIRHAILWNMARWAHRAIGGDGAGVDGVLKQLLILGLECPRSSDAAQYLRRAILRTLGRKPSR